MDAQTLLPIHRRRFRLLLIYGLLSLPWIIWGAQATLKVNANSPLDWVTEAFPARRRFDEFRRMFGSGDVVVVGWEGATIDDPRLPRMVHLLRNSKTFQLPDGSSAFEQVVSGTEVYDTLLRPPIDVSEDEAASRLRGSLLGPDGASTCVVIAFDARGLADRARLVSLIRKAAVRHCEIPAGDLHLAGPVIDGLEVDRASQASLDQFAIPSALGVLFTCLLFLRSQRAAWLVFLLSLFCEGATLALVHFCGDSLSALLIVLPPLIQTAAVSGGIHLVNYYFDFHDAGEADPFGKALRTAWLPCALSAGTTAIGLASLMVSDLSPIRAFGAYGGAGMILTTALLLTVIPGAFLLWPRALLGTRENHNADAAAKVTNAGPDSAAWNLVASSLARWGTVVAAACILLTVGLGWGAVKLHTSVRIETLFGSESRLLRDYAWLEKQIGPLVPMEVVVQCNPRCPLKTLERLSLINRLHGELSRMPGVGGTLSATTFAPLLDRPEGVDPVRFDLLASQLFEAGKPRLEAAGYLHEGSRGESWRLTARVSALARVDYGQFEQAVAERLTPLLTDANGEPLPGVTLSCTGIMPVVHAIQQQLFSDLFSSFLSALAVITLVMIVVQGGLVAGLLSMASNIFPIALVFGWLGWQGGTVDIGSVLTASVALGIAIDNTLHLLTFYRREVDQGVAEAEALRRAYQHCGNAMLQSTLVCLAGTTIFALADFVPTQRFALLMLALLLLAVIGDLVFLPAILMSPLGRYFRHPEDRQRTVPDFALAGVSQPFRFSIPASTGTVPEVQQPVTARTVRTDPGYTNPLPTLTVSPAIASPVTGPSVIASSVMPERAVPAPPSARPGSLPRLVSAPPAIAGTRLPDTGHGPREGLEEADRDGPGESHLPRLESLDKGSHLTAE